jgi:hypothetical protein
MGLSEKTVSFFRASYVTYNLMMQIHHYVRAVYTISSTQCGKNYHENEGKLPE